MKRKHLPAPLWRSLTQASRRLVCASTRWSPPRGLPTANPPHRQRAWNDTIDMTLTLYPAIDLKDGQCVRLRRGAMDQATVFADAPATQARAWQDAGFAWLHVVDLNGAFAGHPVNAAAVTEILGAVQIPVQLGGGIRDMAGIEAWLAAGVRRVILGSAAAKNPSLVLQACRAFPGRVAVGIDARDGMVATEGWAETSTLAARDLALRFEDAGRRGDHLHRHRSRRDVERRQRRGNGRSGAASHDAGHCLRVG